MPRHLTALMMLSLPTASCGYASYDVLDTQGDMGIVDMGLDAGVDMSVVDMGVDMSVVDMGVDMSVVDMGLDAGVDMGLDAGVDMSVVDMGLDAGVDMGLDAGPPPVARFMDLCDATMATVILDGDPTDDSIAARLGVVMAGACGFVVRTVDETDPGILSAADSRPLLGPDDLALVGGNSVHADIMGYLEMADSPVTWTQTATDYVLRDRATNSLVLAWPLSGLTGSLNIGVVEVTVEPISGTRVLTVFGAQNIGARAAAYYFEHQIAPSIGTQTASYYVVRWTNFDLDPNPSAGDTFTAITTP